MTIKLPAYRYPIQPKPFRSRLDLAGANKRGIDLIMGHKSKDVGERVYTHKTIKELREAIELLD